MDEDSSEYFALARQTNDGDVKMFYTSSSRCYSYNTCIDLPHVFFDSICFYTEI